MCGHGNTLQHRYMFLEMTTSCFPFIASTNLWLTKIIIFPLIY